MPRVTPFVLFGVMVAGDALAGEPTPFQATPLLLGVPYHSEIIPADPVQQKRRADQMDRPWIDRLDDFGLADRVDRFEPAAGPEPTVRLERLEPAAGVIRPEGPGRIERPTKLERPEKIEKVKVERPEKIDQSGRQERVERVDRKGRGK